MGNRIEAEAALQQIIAQYDIECRMNASGEHRWPTGQTHSAIRVIAVDFLGHESFRKF